MTSTTAHRTAPPAASWTRQRLAAATAPSTTPASAAAHRSGWWNASAYTARIIGATTPTWTVAAVSPPASAQAPASAASSTPVTRTASPTAATITEPCRNRAFSLTARMRAVRCSVRTAGTAPTPAASVPAARYRHRAGTGTSPRGYAHTATAAPASPTAVRPRCQPGSPGLASSQPAPTCAAPNSWAPTAVPATAAPQPAAPARASDWAAASVATSTSGTAAPPAYDAGAMVVSSPGTPSSPPASSRYGHQRVRHSAASVATIPIASSVHQARPVPADSRVSTGEASPTAYRGEAATASNAAPAS